MDLIIPKSGAQLVGESNQNLFTFDGSKDKTIYSATHTAHPTERGFVSDNRKINPVKLQISGLKTESPFFQEKLADARAGKFTADRVENDVDELLLAFSEHKTMTVITGFAVHENHFIEEITIDREVAGASVPIVIHFGEVKFVDLEFVTVPDDILIRKNKKKDVGSQGKDEPTEKEKAKLKEIQNKSFFAAAADGDLLAKASDATGLKLPGFK